MGNLGLRQARIQLVEFINGLPYEIEVKRMLVREIYDELVEASNTAVAQETEALKQAKEKDESAAETN